MDIEGEGDERLSKTGTKIRTLIAALSEEDHSNLRGDELDEFLADAASLQDNYRTMLQMLAQNSELVRYRQGTPEERAGVARLVDAMRDTGMKILGPTADQLVHCAETIQNAAGDAADFLADMTALGPSSGRPWRARPEHLDAESAWSLPDLKLAMMSFRSQRVDAPPRRLAVADASMPARSHPPCRDRDGSRCVWSDDVYGDREPDGVPEVPVSRMPDARLGPFLMSDV